MLNRIKSGLIIFVGISLTAAASGLFLIPNELVTGGVSGIATILYTWGITPGIVYLIINSLLLAVSYKILGKRFVVTSVISVIIMSVEVDFFSKMKPLTDNIMLATIYGSVLFGIGAAMALVQNANTGGTDIVGRLIQVKYQYFPIGTLLLIIDGVIILVSLLVFRNVELALYGLLGLFVSTYVINFFIDKLNSSKLALVITEKGDKISKTIIENSRRGVTILNARGAYSGNRKNLLICAIKNKEMPDFHKMITEHDQNAFVIFTKSEKVFGLGFYVYK